MDIQKLDELTLHYLGLTQWSAEVPVDRIEKTYDELIEVVNYHNELYYIQSNSKISDYEYDKLFSLIKKIEQNYPDIIKEFSPTQKLTYQIQDEFQPAEHRIPMASLENTYNAQDLIDWNNSISRLLQKISPQYSPSFIVEPKYDGISMDVVYKDGVFHQAITRGDWNIGEDVTHNVKTIKSVAKKLSWSYKGEIRVRWEVVMPKSMLVKINAERQATGLALFANTRNATSGSVRQLDTEITANRGLEFFPYAVIILDQATGDSEQTSDIREKNLDVDGRGWLYQSNPTENRWQSTDGRQQQEEMINNIYSSFRNFGKYDYLFQKEYASIEDIVSLCEDQSCKNALDNEDIEFDGLVIKLKNLDFRAILGSTAHHPRWAVAYKFPAKQIMTRLLGVTFNVGRTWIITPVAKLQTVNISWVNVTNATLHNFDFITQKDIQINDYVLIQRSGEVIPYVLWPVLDKRWNDLIPIVPPTHCPICNSESVRLEGEAYYYCSNINCPAVIKEKLVHYVSKDCMNIDGFWDKFIDLLVEGWLIKHFSDMYKLKDPQTKIILRGLPLMGDKRVSDLLWEIEKSKNNPVWRILHALGIRQVGKKTAQILEEEIYNKCEKLIDDFNVEKLINLLTDQEFLNNIYGIWPETVQSLQAYIWNFQNIEILNELEAQGVLFNNFSVAEKKANLPLDGIHFSVTWKFDLSRPKIVEILQSYWAVWDEEPLKDTQFMLIWTDPWSKAEKARSYGIKIYSSLQDIAKEFKIQITETSKVKPNEAPKQQSLF